MPILLGNNLLGQVLHSAGSNNYGLGTHSEQDQHHDHIQQYLQEGVPDDQPQQIGTEGGRGGLNTPGILLAAVSVIFIIIAIAFVFSRLRRKKGGDELDEVEMAETQKERDPYMEWLNMPESEPPSPTLKKQVKTAVKTVSRKISLNTKPPADDWTPGVPPHLRYQLKQIYVY